MRDLLTTVESWRANGRRGVLVRAIDVTGFGAGQYDNAMVINDLGETHGELLRGLATDRIVDVVTTMLAESAGPLPAQLLEVAADTPQAEAVGLSCGGRARVVIEVLDTIDPRLWNAIRGGETFAIATWLDDAPTTLVVQESGTTPPPADGDHRDIASVVATAREMLGNQRSNRVSLDENDIAVMIDKVVPRTRILAVGVGEVIEALVDQGRTLGWTVDPLPEGDDAITAAGELGAADALVITTHHPELGPALLAAALTSDSFFVGALGSRHTQQARAERLRTLGHDDDAIARVHGPVGLDLGGRTPAETALAICAEIVAVRSGRSIASLRDQTGSING